MYAHCKLSKIKKTFIQVLGYILFNKNYESVNYKFNVKGTKKQNKIVIFDI